MRLRQLIPALGVLLAAAPALQAQATPRRAQDSIVVDTARAKRWAELHILVMSELRRDGRDLRDVVRGDFSTLEIAVRKSDNRGFLSRTLTAEEIDKGDLTALAAKIVSASRG